jgi:hypothetical protein
MPYIVLSNMISTLGLVNGTRGTASEINLESESRYPLFLKDLLFSSIIANYFQSFCIALDDIHLSPRTLLLQQLHPLEISFKSHEINIIPVYYPITKTILVNNESICRRNIPVFPAFCLANKAQGQTFSEMALDML